MTLINNFPSRANELQVAVALHLGADEPKVQTAALKCLQAFKHKYLNQHLERLLRWVKGGTCLIFYIL